MLEPAIDANASPPYRLRGDLQWVRRETLPDRRWIIFDPIQSDFLLLSEIEASIAVRLNGQSTLKDLSTGLDSDGVPYRVSPQWLVQFFQRLRSLGLLLTTRPDPTAIMNPPRANRHLVSRLPELLQIRVPWVDPAPWIDQLVPWFGIFFQRPGRWLWGCGMVLTGLSFLQTWPRLGLELPFAVSSLFSDRWWFLLLVLLASKAAHEAGHAIACHAFGARCHEMGLMFLLGVPCLYCDVTDAWRIADPKKRAMIAAAGVYVEMIIAMLAYWIWYSSDSPVVRLSALQIFLSSTVVTLLLNGNPLMRYDGYYVFSDLLGINNLSERAREQWQAWKRSWRLEQDRNPGEERMPRSSIRTGFVAYHVGSVLYRWFVVFGLLLGIRTATITAGLSPLSAQTWVILGLAILGGQKFVLTHMGGSAEGRGNRKAFRLLIWACVVAFIVLLPIPRLHTARGILRPTESHAIHVRQSSFLVECVPDGQKVEAGDVILRMESPELTRRSLQLEGDWNVLLSRIEQLQRRAVDDPVAPGLLVEAQEQMAGMGQRRNEIQQELDKLVVRAPANGILLFAREWKLPIQNSERAVGKNLLADALAEDRLWLERGTHVADIQAQESPWRMQVIVQEADLASLQSGTSIGVRVDQSPMSQWYGSIERIEIVQETGPKKEFQERDRNNIAERREWLEQNRVMGAEFRVIVHIDGEHPAWSRDGQGSVRWQGHWSSGLDWIRAWISKDFAFGNVTMNFAPVLGDESRTRTDPLRR